MERNMNHIFEAVYESESDAIFRFCLIRVSNRDQALDITQETFLRFWQTLTQNKEVVNNRAFLFTVARRLIIDWYRKKKSISFGDIESKSDDEEDFNPSDEMTLDKLHVGAEGRYLLDKINELSPGYRQAVYLRFVEDLSPQEIGDILGISANTASVRINRGIEELKQKTCYQMEKKTY